MRKLLSVLQPPKYNRMWNVKDGGRDHDVAKASKM